MRSVLPALEKNILKYRALQMILLLHQVDSLKAFVIGSIRGSHILVSNGGVKQLPDGTKKPMKIALSLLVQKGVITEKESQDLQRIICLRNKIGHSIHELVEDISAPRAIRNRDSIYDYFALEEFERYRAKISSGMAEHFILEVGFRELSFEQAEATYKEELVRLRKRIQRQYEARRAAT